MTDLPGKAMIGGTLSRAATWAVVVAAATLRLLWLDADPPGFILDEFITDEGWYAQSARNHAVFGRWVTDEHNVPLVLCPLHTLALRLSYAGFGVSFWSTRLPGALASCFTIAAVAWGLRRSAVAAATAALLLATQPILFGLARVGYCESLQLLFVTTAWLCASDSRRRSLSWVASGAAAGFAVCAKMSAVYAPALALLAPLLTAAPGDRRRIGKESALVALGLALAAAAMVPFVLPYASLFWVEQAREGGVLWHGEGAPAGLFLPLQLGLHYGSGVLPGFWVGTFPVLTAFGVAVAALVAARVREDGNAGPRRLAAAWLVLSLGFLCLRRAPATQERYWANLIVPMACLLGLAVAQGSLAPARLERWRTWLVAACLAIGPALVARQLAFAIFAGAIGEPLPALVRVRYVAPVMLVAAILLASALRAAQLVPRLAGRAAALATAAAAVLVGAVAVCSSAPPTYTIRDASRALAARPNLVLTGDLANTLALETAHWAFVCRDLSDTDMGSGWVNGDYAALGATHWVGDKPPGVDGWRTRAPAGAAVEATYPVWPDRRGRARLTVFVSSLAGVEPAMLARP